jgi:hypothetical protein
VVVKKTFHYSNVFSYNHLYPKSVIRNIIMESGINLNAKLKIILNQGIYYNPG